MIPIASSFKKGNSKFMIILIVKPKTMKSLSRSIRKMLQNIFEQWLFGSELITKAMKTKTDKKEDIKPKSFYTAKNTIGTIK